MRTTTKPPRKEKMVPFPASMDRRVTLALHALEGIPDDMLRAVASHAPGERVRALAETGVVRYATGVLTPTPDERLEERVAALEKALANVKGLAEGAQFLAHRLPDNARERLENVERSLALQMGTLYHLATDRQNAAHKGFDRVETMTCALEGLIPEKALRWAEQKSRGQDPDLPFESSTLNPAEA